VPIHEDGIRSGALPERATTRLCVTPSHQYPTGHILSLARRQAIDGWYQRPGCYILEHDYDAGLAPSLARAARSTLKRRPGPKRASS
jgi:GntR family transcriptional regulator/MocR family aminotransferase